MSSWMIFYSTLLKREFLLKWYNFFWNFCRNRGFLLCTTISIDFNSQISFPVCWGVGFRNFGKVGVGNVEKPELESEILKRSKSELESDILPPTPQPWFLHNTTRLRTCVPDTGTHLPGMALPRTAWVRLNRLLAGVGRSRSRLYKWGMAPSVWRRRANRRPCRALMPNPSTSPWTARPDGSGWWDNWMAAKRLPQWIITTHSNDEEEVTKWRK